MCPPAKCASYIFFLLLLLLFFLRPFFSFSFSFFFFLNINGKRHLFAVCVLLISAGLTSLVVEIDKALEINFEFLLQPKQPSTVT